MNDRSKCVILVPYQGAIAPDCDRSLRSLEIMGYEVRRVGGYSAIDQGRCQMATDALEQGFDETIWIDSDIAFEASSIEVLRSRQAELVCGIYPLKNQRSLACHVMPGTSSLGFGREGGLTEVLYAGTGFMLVRRCVYEAIQIKLGLPVCNERFSRPLIPFFAPMVIPTDPGYWYLAEDYAFCHRARQCGYKVLADTTIRLWHIGSQLAGWEAAQQSPQRFDSFRLNLTSGV